jgi:DNA helicase-2/ATP-dependent DNA helicase PcrA
MNLSDRQEEIVKAPIGGAMQILASAGSGKTRVLTERIKHILNTNKRDGVIGITFTNKAAEEMQNRLADCENIEERAWIATIHSAAQHILEKYSHTIGLPDDLYICKEEEDRIKIYLQFAKENEIEVEKENIKKYIEAFSFIKRELLNEQDILERYPDGMDIWNCYQIYQNALLNSAGVDYDDLLVYAHKILRYNESICKIYRAKYKHICVDEAQDLNKAQYELIKVLCGDAIKSILMVGDKNQMIYGFNGSSHDYLCKFFVEDFKPEKYVLNENFRSTKEVIRISNILKPNSQKEMEYAYKGLVKFNECETEESEANWIIKKINFFLNLKKDNEIEGEISLDKMVVIARNRFVLCKLKEKLKENNILYFFKKGERDYLPESQFGQILDYSMRYKLNPKNWIDKNKRDALLKTESKFNSIYNQLLSFIDDLDIEEPNIPKFIKSMDDIFSNIRKDLKNDKEIEELNHSKGDLDIFNSYWTKFKRLGLGNSLNSFYNALALGRLASNSNNGGLTLSTVHTMKGLEKDIVFLMGMCEGVFPDYRANSSKEIEEERNNAFVAVTRAKRWLFVSYPKQRVMPWGEPKFQTASCFFMEMKGENFV